VALSWPIAFVLTLAVEAPVYVLGTRRSLSWPAALGGAAAANLATHPLAFWWIARARSWARFGVTELAVTCIESFVLWLIARVLRRDRPLRWTEAAMVSVSANALSAGIGLLLS
jgi:hypothetical protein